MKLKVYGWNIDGRNRGIVATTSWRAAYDAAQEVNTASSLGGMRSMGSVTWNANEIRTAMSEPGTVFVQSTRGHDEPFVPLRPNTLPR